MFILALDTVFGQCSVAVLKNDTLIDQSTVQSKRDQTQIILPMIDELLQKNQIPLSQITALGFNQGPGAFSGIRINASVIQAFSFAHDIQCVGVSSLLLLAQSFLWQNTLKQTPMERAIIASAIDARQNEVYANIYTVQNNSIIYAQNEQLLPYQYMLEADFVVGDGADLVQTNAQKISITPGAFDVGRMAYVHFLQSGGVPAHQALPVYLRHNAWKTIAEQKSQKNI